MPARSRIPNQQQAKLLARIWSAEDDPEICPVDDAEWIPPALRAALRLSPYTHLTLPTNREV